MKPITYSDETCAPPLAPETIDAAVARLNRSPVEDPILAAIIAAKIEQMNLLFTGKKEGRLL